MVFINRESELLSEGCYWNLSDQLLASIALVLPSSDPLLSASPYGIIGAAAEYDPWKFPFPIVEYSKFENTATSSLNPT